MILKWKFKWKWPRARAPKPLAFKTDIPFGTFLDATVGTDDAEVALRLAAALSALGKRRFLRRLARVPPAERLTIITNAANAFVDKLLEVGRHVAEELAHPSA